MPSKKESPKALPNISTTKELKAHKKMVEQRDQSEPERTSDNDENTQEMEEETHSVKRRSNSGSKNKRSSQSLQK